MDQRTRMFKTLGCLVGAMICTSALLGRIDPSPAICTELPSYEALVAQARSQVTADVDVRQGRWREIEVIVGPAQGDTVSFLTATANQPVYHFRIGLDGRPTRASGWVRQKAFDWCPRTIRVQVARRKPGEPMSRAQWHGVQAVVAALNECVVCQGSALPVHLDQDWALVYDMDPGIPIELPR